MGGGGVVEAEALQPRVRDDAAIAARVNTSFVFCVCVFTEAGREGGLCLELLSHLQRRSRCPARKRVWAQKADRRIIKCEAVIRGCAASAVFTPLGASHG